MKNQLEVLEDLYQNLRFTQIVHEKEAYISKLSSTVLKLINVALISLILLLQILQSKNHGGDYTGLSIFLAVVGIALQAFQLSFNFENKHDLHRAAAKRAVELKNKLMVLKADVTKVTKMSVELAIQRDRMVDEINDLYKSAPQTGFIARILADHQLKPRKNPGS